MSLTTSGYGGYGNGGGHSRTPDEDHQPGNLGWCRYCGERIYWLYRPGCGWRPFESWVEGNASEGEWIYHDC